MIQRGNDMQTIPGSSKCCATCVFWGGNFTIPRLGGPRQTFVRVLDNTAKCSRYNVVRTPRGGGGNCPYYKKRYELT